MENMDLKCGETMKSGLRLFMIILFIMENMGIKSGENKKCLEIT